MGLWCRRTWQWLALAGFCFLATWLVLGGHWPALGNGAVVTAHSLLLDSGSLVYGIKTDVSGSFNQLVAFNSNAPKVLTNISNNYGPLSVVAGDFLGGDSSTLYAVNDETLPLYPGQFMTIDTATGQNVSIALANPVAGDIWRGMAGDPTTNTLYAASCASYGDISTLYVIDHVSGAVRIIGADDGACIDAIAINAAGELFGLDTLHDELVRIDKATAAIAPIGPLGYTGFSGQGMDFDDVTGVLYISDYFGNSRLRIADPETGATTKIGLISDGVRMWSLAVADSENDFIFKDAFESNDLSAWTGALTDGGDLSVAAEAAIAGDFGMKVLIDDTNRLFAFDTSPGAESRYRARFLFDPNSLVIQPGDRFVIFAAGDSTSARPERSAIAAPAPVFAVEFGMDQSGQYDVRGMARDGDGSLRTTSPFLLNDAPNMIEIWWQADDPDNNTSGLFSLYVNDLVAKKVTIPYLDNDAHRIEWAALGVPRGIPAGAGGTLYFDSFESRRITYIGLP